MVITYHIYRIQHKKLTTDIAEALRTLPRYMMYPNCNYVIRDCILDRNGKLIIHEIGYALTSIVLLKLRKTLLGPGISACIWFYLYVYRRISHARDH